MKVILFSFFAALIATAQSLECYQCSDCGDVKGIKPSICQEVTTEMPPTDETTIDTTAYTTTESATTTTNIPDETTVVQSSQDDFFSKLEGSPEILRNYNYKSIITRENRATDGAHWFCYEAHITANDKSFINRGCVNNVVNNKCPDDLKASVTGQITACSVCQNDGCNNSSAIAKLSFLALLFVFIAKLIA